MPTTLGQKSRMGCRECKTRKVKCDEQRPICGSCSKFNKSCSFLRTTPYLWGSGLLNQTIERGKANSSRKPRLNAGKGLSKHAKDISGSTLEDMRLLHHFTSCTSATLSDDPEAHRTWATTVNILGERCLSPKSKPNIGNTKFQQLHDLTKKWDTDIACTMSDARENEINSRALEILVEAFNIVSEDSKANTGRVSVNELLNDALLPEDENHRRVNGSNYLSLSFGWLFEIPIGFVELLEQRRPATLIIFAYFSVLFQNAPKFWWNEPIPAKIVKAVAAVLPPEYHRWIEWPIRETQVIQSQLRQTQPIAQYPECRKPGQTERPRARVCPPISLQPRPADKQQTRQEPTNPTSAVNLASLSVPQLRALQTRLTSELEHLTTSHTKLRAAQAKFRDCVRSITDGVTGNEKKGTDGRNEILVPLTSSLYVKGRLTDREKVLVDVGTGFYVEKTPAKATEFYDGKVKDLETNLGELEKIVQTKSTQLRVVEESEFIPRGWHTRFWLQCVNIVRRLTVSQH
ncbi:unnamed protein product [Penicillium salamii]|uniref:Zn(2)-C6 fungal-type domain-containing protein n=1 Tax=Penicillium salamii TaxID=1612424 RepID=A0A9W4ND36_9EURO|nr:unnamed protein product [Penicillium salamii]